MKKLPKYTLAKNKKKGTWDLTEDKSGKTIKSFKTKDRATTGGVLRKSLGNDGGSVKIKLENNKYQEERTYPKSKDPKGSKG